MRTTIDLPDDLLKQAKILAVRRGSSLRDLVAAGLRTELARAEAAPLSLARLPVLHVPPDAPVLKMTPLEISQALKVAEALDDASRVA